MFRWKQVNKHADLRVGMWTVTPLLAPRRMKWRSLQREQANIHCGLVFILLRTTLSGIAPPIFVFSAVHTNILFRLCVYSAASCASVLCLCVYFFLCFCLSVCVCAVCFVSSSSGLSFNVSFCCVFVCQSVCLCVCVCLCVWSRRVTFSIPGVTSRFPDSLFFSDTH